MTSESQNKLLARRLLEEVVNSGDVDRLPEFLAPNGGPATQPGGLGVTKGPPSVS